MLPRFVEKAFWQVFYRRKLKRQADWNFPHREAASGEASSSPAESKSSKTVPPYPKGPQFKSPLPVFKPSASPKTRYYVKSPKSDFKKKLLLMVGITVVLVFTYFCWARIAVFLGRAVLGGDCGYRRGLFEPYKECLCRGKTIEISWMGKKTKFCLGQCSECRCWQLEMTAPEGRKVNRVSVECQ